MTEEITSKNLLISEIINQIKSEVDKSEFGPLTAFERNDTGEMRKVVNPVAFQVFMVFLNNYLETGRIHAQNKGK